MVVLPVKYIQYPLVNVVLDRAQRVFTTVLFMGLRRVTKAQLG